jgi:PAP2 superfamily
MPVSGSMSGIRVRMKTTGGDVWLVYVRWLGLNLLAYLFLYPFCNWITGLRSFTLGLYLPFECRIPFVPSLIWAYLSINVLIVLALFILDASQFRELGRQMLAATLISCAFFLLFPAHLGFLRTVPDSPIYRNVFNQLFMLDKPYNLVPSLHISYATLCVGSYRKAIRSTGMNFAFLVWLALIAVATLLVHQHHLLDILTGALLAWRISVWIDCNTQSANTWSLNAGRRGLSSPTRHGGTR